MTRFIQAGFGEHNRYELTQDQRGRAAYRRCNSEGWTVRRINKQGYIKFLNWSALHVETGRIVGRSEGGFIK